MPQFERGAEISECSPTSDGVPGCSCCWCRRIFRDHPVCWFLLLLLSALILLTPFFFFATSEFGSSRHAGIQLVPAHASSMQGGTSRVQATATGFAAMNDTLQYANLSELSVRAELPRPPPSAGMFLLFTECDRESNRYYQVMWMARLAVALDRRLVLVPYMGHFRVWVPPPGWSGQQYTTSLDLMYDLMQLDQHMRAVRTEMGREPMPTVRGIDMPLVITWDRYLRDVLELSVEKDDENNAQTSFQRGWGLRMRCQDGSDKEPDIFPWTGQVRTSCHFGGVLGLAIQPLQRLPAPQGDCVTIAVLRSFSQ
jgi:hypothetical protein